MKHSGEVQRLFRKTDEEMLQQSEVLLDSFQTNKILFVERFPHMGELFANEWVTTMAAARAIPPDYALVAKQASQSYALRALMLQGRMHFQTVIFYVQIAFPGDLAILKSFGQAQYNLARTNQLKLPLLLRTTSTQASKPEYQPALMAKGLKESDIALLNTLAERITNQDVALQKAKKERSRTTGQRITIMNAVWEKMTTVCRCAKLVFQDDTAKYNLFMLTNTEVPKASRTIEVTS